MIFSQALSVDTFANPHCLPRGLLSGAIPMPVSTPRWRTRVRAARSLLLCPTKGQAAAATPASSAEMEDCNMSIHSEETPEFPEGEKINTEKDIKFEFLKPLFLPKDALWGSHSCFTHRLTSNKKSVRRSKDTDCFYLPHSLLSSLQPCVVSQVSRSLF